MEDNVSIDEKIKSYEPLMNRVLKDYHVTMDIDDFMQELRVSTWKVLTDTNPETRYLEKSKAKFITYLYNVLKNRVKDILKVEYKIKLTPEKNRKELTKTELLQRRIAKPNYFEELSYEQKLNAVMCSHDAEGIRMATDIEAFLETLDPIDKVIWELKLESRNNTEISIILKERGIANKTDRTIGRRLEKIIEAFTKFMETGGYNG